MAPIKVGLLGYGNAARVFHLPYILPHPEDFELTAIYQRSEPTEGKRHCTTDFPDVKWYKDQDEFLKDPNVELVLVLTPHGNDEHYKGAKAALLAGKHGMLVLPS
jgi:predicted dehydrogenase